MNPTLFNRKPSLEETIDRLRHEFQALMAQRPTIASVMGLPEPSGYTVVNGQAMPYFIEPASVA